MYKRQVYIYTRYQFLFSKNVAGTCLSGWSQLISPNSFNVRCPRRLRETLKFCIRLWYQVCASAEPLTIFFFCIAQIFVLYFGRILIVRDATFPAKKQKIKQKSFVNGSPGAYITRAKFQGVSLQTGVDIWTNCAVNVQKNTASRPHYLASVLMRFWAFKYDFMLVLRGQFFEYLRETLYKHAFGTTWKPLVLPAETPYYYWPLLRPVIGRDTFLALAPSLRGPFNNKTVSVTLFHMLMAVRTVPNMLHSSCYCFRYSWLTNFFHVEMLEPAPTKKWLRKNLRNFGTAGIWYFVLFYFFHCIIDVVFWNERVCSLVVLSFFFCRTYWRIMRTSYCLFDDVPKCNLFF